MNIFRIENDPRDCAVSMCDKHVVKMILETGQMLSTAHRLLDGHLVIEDYIDSNGKTRKRKHWKLDDDRESILYRATHANHPSNKWCRETNNNYNWLYCHLVSLCNEYTHRYGKIHKMEREGLLKRLESLPNNIYIGYLTPLPCAMGDEYVVSNNVVENYRNYYKNAKSHLHKWTNREAPVWL